MNALGDSKRLTSYRLFSLNIVLDLPASSAALGVWRRHDHSAGCRASSTRMQSGHDLSAEAEASCASTAKCRPDRPATASPLRRAESVIGFANVIVQSNINSFGSRHALARIQACSLLPVTSHHGADDLCRRRNRSPAPQHPRHRSVRAGIIASVVIKCGADRRDRDGLALLAARRLLQPTLTPRHAQRQRPRLPARSLQTSGGALADGHHALLWWSDHGIIVMQSSTRSSTCLHHHLRVAQLIGLPLYHSTVHGFDKAKKI